MRVYYNDQLEYQLYSSRRISMRNNSVLNYLSLLPIAVLIINILIGYLDGMLIMLNIISVALYLILILTSNYPNSNSIKRKMKRAFNYLEEEYDQDIKYKDKKIRIIANGTKLELSLYSIKEIVKTDKHAFLIMSNTGAVIIPLRENGLELTDLIEKDYNNITKNDLTIAST